MTIPADLSAPPPWIPEKGRHEKTISSPSLSLSIILISLDDKLIGRQASFSIYDCPQLSVCLI